MDVDENHNKELSPPPKSNDQEENSNEEGAQEAKAVVNNNNSPSKQPQSDEEKATKNKNSKAQQKHKKKVEDNVVKAKKSRTSKKLTDEIEEELEGNSQDDVKSVEPPEASDAPASEEKHEKEEKKKEKLPRKMAKENKETKEKEKLSKTLESTIPMMDDPNLPAGWYRKVVQRQTGKTAGHFDVYLYSPEGKRFRSRFELINHLTKTNSPLNVDDFDFTVRGKKNTPRSLTRKISKPVVKKNSAKKIKDESSTTKNAAKRRLVVKLDFKAGQKNPSKEGQEGKKSSLGSGSKKKAPVNSNKASTPVKVKKGLKKKKTGKRR